LGNGCLGEQQKVAAKPNLGFGSYALSDFDSDGNLNLIILQGKESGYYEYNRDKEVWDGFKSFTATPHVRPLDTHTQLIDLTGDGLADIVTVEEDRIIWYPSKGKEGFGKPLQLSNARSNGVSRAPSIGSIPMLDYFFADMNGSGLPDQVKVYNGRVEYWPNMGNGNFGSGIVMEDSPQLDFDFELDASRIRLIDLDGSGTADLLYIGRGEIRYWINACGNRFVEGETIRGLPFIDNISSAQVIDFLGDGTPCLVWSSTLSIHADAPIHYLRLTNGVKPRMLMNAQNSMGQETILHYGYSGTHYLRDKDSAIPWITKIPSHRTVVDKIEMIDHIGNTRFSQRYEYHDGFYDGEERAFRGFCLVDQYDSDLYRGTSGIPETEFTDPVCVRTWVHNGSAEWQNTRLKSYCRNDGFSTQLRDFQLEDPEAIGAEEFYPAVRSLAGQVIRSEVYGLDRQGNRKQHPFQVGHNTYLIRRTQPGTKGHDPGFSFFQRESLEIIYEEGPADPRVTHSLNVLINNFGAPVLQAVVAYPRTSADAMPEQRSFHISAVQTEVDYVDLAERYEVAEWEKKSFDLKLGSYPAAGTLFSLQAVADLVELTITSSISFDQDFSGGEEARLLQWSRNYYWNDDQTTVLPWREAGTKILIHHQEVACFHNRFLENALGEYHNPAYVAQGHYAFHDAYWWKPGASIRYHSFNQFYFPQAEIQPDGGRMEYQSDHYFLTLQEITAVLTDRTGISLSNQSTTAEIDYHLMAPYRIIDVNNNTSEVRYDALGVVMLSILYGDILSDTGGLARCGHGHLDVYEEVGEINFEAIINNPRGYLQQCANFFYYELDSWQTLALPLRSISLARSEWVYDGQGGYQPEGNFQVGINYRDGFGRTIQSKTLVEPGPDVIHYENGVVVLDAQGEPRLFVSDQPRWQVSGHTVFNNKQKPVRQFEPYFSPLVAYESDEVLWTFGESGLIEYDALGRQKAIVRADGTLSRIVVTPWQTSQYDANDVVTDSPYALRVLASYSEGTPEREALAKAQLHYDTPVVSHSDGLGRVFLTEEQNEEGTIRRTRIILDGLGNPRQIIDPRGLIVQTYHRDMPGRIFHEESKDAGAKYQFINALDQSIHLWDGRGVHQEFTYDTWGRPLQKRVYGALGGMDKVTNRFIYGEEATISNASDRNLFGQLVAHYDHAGVTNIQKYDLNGNVLEKEKRLLVDYKIIPDWSATAEPLWMPGLPFVTKIIYDAVGRPTEQHLPDNTIRIYSYLQSGGLKQLSVTTADGILTDQPIASNVIYNARGQRTQLKLGSDVFQQYEYDPYNFRLKRRSSYRRATEILSARHYQNIRYTYDAVGNITHMVDTAQPGDANVLSESRISEYTYDAFYQLIHSQGRTHEALEKNTFAHLPNAIGFTKGVQHISLNNNDLVRQYSRRYHYDLSGNMVSMLHDTLLDGRSVNHLRRDYWISEHSNRSLPNEDVSGNPISNPESHFDGNGNMLYMPHLRDFKWNYLNQLASAVTISREDGVDDVEYYVYGGDGQRVRKVWEQLNHGAIEIIEKIYLDGCEIKRVRHGSTILLERYTSHLSGGSERIALLHQWTIDTRGQETDSITEKKIHYQLSDHLGSSTFELNERGDIINYEEYFPFGGSAFIAGDNLRGVELKDYRYSGKERDEATRLYYYGFRYYAPWLCRWINPDPIGIEDGLNVYQFVHNDPVNGKDEKGLQDSRRARTRSITAPPPADLFTSDQLEQLRSHDGPFALIPAEGGTELHLFGSDAERTQFLEGWHQEHPDQTITIYGTYESGLSERVADALSILNPLPTTQSEESTNEDETASGGEGEDSGGLSSASGEGSRSGDGNGESRSSTTATASDGTPSSSAPRESSGASGALGNPFGRPGRRGVDRSIPEVPIGETPEELRGRTPKMGTADPSATGDGNPNGRASGPEDVNSELPAGAYNPGGSPEGSTGGSPEGRLPEELAGWQIALIVLAVIVVALITAGAAAYLLAAAGMVGGLTIGVSLEAATIIGVGSGLTGGFASDAVSQGLTMGFGAQQEFNWAQFAFSGVTGAFTGGLGTSATGASTVARQLTVGRFLMNGASRFAIGAAEGGGLELLREGIMGEELNLTAIGLNAVIGGGVSAGVGGGLDLWSARRPNISGAAAGRDRPNYPINPDGATRTEDEARAMAARAGIWDPEDEIQLLFVNKLRTENADGDYVLARGDFDSQRGNPHVLWKNFLTGRKGADDPQLMVPILRSVLNSDERILGTIAHEMHELNGIRNKLVENRGLSVTDLNAEIARLHIEAVELERNFYLAMRIMQFVNK
jgi:RHS repeat-associated protein